MAQAEVNGSTFVRTLCLAFRAEIFSCEKNVFDGFLKSLFQIPAVHAEECVAPLLLSPDRRSRTFHFFRNRSRDLAIRSNSQSQYCVVYILGSSSSFHSNTEVLLCMSTTKIKSFPLCFANSTIKSSFIS